MSVKLHSDTRLADASRAGLMANTYLRYANMADRDAGGIPIAIGTATLFGPKP